MAPIATEDLEAEIKQLKVKEQQGAPTASDDTHKPGASTQPDRKPLKANGSLDTYDKVDLTPVIGREFPKANLVEWLKAPNADELLTELAYTSELHL